MTSKNKTSTKLSKKLKFITRALTVIAIINGIAFCALFIELNSFKEFTLEMKFPIKIISDLDGGALITIPTYYTEEYKEKLLKKGLYLIEEPETIKIERKELTKLGGVFSIINGNAYIFVDKHILGAILDKEYSGDPTQLLKGIELYQKESLCISKNKTMNKFGINAIILLLLAIVSSYFYEHTKPKTVLKNKQEE